MCLGIPGLIEQVTDFERRLATVSVAGVRRTVNVACIARERHELEACVGEWVLVHVGFAMSRIDPVEARKTLDLRNELGEVQAELAAMRGTDADGSPGRRP